MVEFSFWSLPNTMVVVGIFHRSVPLFCTINSNDYSFIFVGDCGRKEKKNAKELNQYEENNDGER